MAEAILEMPPTVTEIKLRFTPLFTFTGEQFFEFCQLNRGLQIERTRSGDIVIMAPTGGATGNRNASLNAQLYLWARQDGTGRVFDSSTGFTLPNGAERAPDASWVLRTRLARLTAEEKQRFLPLCPDFVIELRSPTDKLPKLQDKMAEYRENGAQLGWLIDPLERRVHIYRPDVPIEIVNNPATISGDPELHGFALDLREIWTPDI